MRKIITLALTFIILVVIMVIFRLNPFTLGKDFSNLKKYSSLHTENKELESKLKQLTKDKYTTCKSLSELENDFKSIKSCSVKKTSRVEIIDGDVIFNSKSPNALYVNLKPNNNTDFLKDLDNKKLNLLSISYDKNRDVSLIIKSKGD